MNSRRNYGRVSSLLFILILLLRSSIDEVLMTGLAFYEKQSIMTNDQENASCSVNSQPFSFAKEIIMNKSCLMR